MKPKLRALFVSASLLALAACRGGINAGGESETSNGGVAWIAMSGMLITIGIVLYIILGREE
ncbi:MAG: hypothetical protein QOG54_340 [Actinomycetota bacterium]|jgi:hypothetical protein|nr:hypothetical protein [Actinomycetota bacterium]